MGSKQNQNQTTKKNFMKIKTLSEELLSLYYKEDLTVL